MFNDYRYKLVSHPDVDMYLLPLALPEPDINKSGGYQRVSVQGYFHNGAIDYRTAPAYAPLDLLVAGLESKRLDIIVSNLSSFFSDRRHTQSLPSEHHIYIVYTQYLEDEYPTKGKFFNENLSQIKTRILDEKNTWLLKVMRANAPFTFRYIMV